MQSEPAKSLEDQQLGGSPLNGAAMSQAGAVSKFPGWVKRPVSGPTAGLVPEGCSEYTSPRARITIK